MENKREEMVLNIASKLDAITSSNGEITKLAIEIVENKNDAATVELCKRLSIFAGDESKQVVHMSQSLKNALVNNHSSLLPKGIIDVTGNFLISQIVDIVDEEDNLLARGMVNYSSDEIKLIKGLNTSEIESILNYKDYDEIVHANNLVLVEGVKNND